MDEFVCPRRQVFISFGDSLRFWEGQSPARCYPEVCWLFGDFFFF